MQVGSYFGGVENANLSALANNSRYSSRLEFLIDLTDNQWQGKLRSNHKRKIKKAEKAALETRVITANSTWEMTKLRRNWSIRKGFGSGFGGFIKDLRYFYQLHKTLTKHNTATPWGIYDGDKLLSFAFILEKDKRAFYMLGASAPKGYNVGASIKLMRDIALAYQQQSFMELNLGGVPAEACEEGHDEFGVYRYKKGFGIDPVTRVDAIIPLDRLPKS